ncbi:hypothetical protein LIER_38743 [Lithospermum erythrorhizon]|uniref:Uncharacterized protein n=1 Tax=Lithospermum erythrorhizon TaxID=34254 RepID=A0AAV3Q5Q0_LITER
MKKPHSESPKKKKIDAKRGQEKMIDNNDGESDFEELDKLLDECDILQEEGCLKKTTKTGRDKNDEVNGMENDSEVGKPKDLQQAEERRCSNRETKESKYKKIPLGKKSEPSFLNFRIGEKTIGLFL